MFALISGEVSLIYKIFHKYDIVSVIFIAIGLIAIGLLYSIQKTYKKEVKKLLRELEE